MALNETQICGSQNTAARKWDFHLLKRILCLALCSADLMVLAEHGIPLAPSCWNRPFPLLQMYDLQWETRLCCSGPRCPSSPHPLGCKMPSPASPLHASVVCVDNSQLRMLTSLARRSRLFPGLSIFLQIIQLLSGNLFLLWHFSHLFIPP